VVGGGIPGRSSWFPGTEVDGAQNGSWRCHCIAQLYLVAKSHIGVNVDGLACPLHRPTVCVCQTIGHSFLSGAALSHRAIVGSGALLRGGQPLGLDI
jgi:hypothetical protein